MAKWINRSTNKIETFGAEKRRIKSNEFNQNLRIFENMKDVLPIPIFADQDIFQRAKYLLQNLAI